MNNEQLKRANQIVQRVGFLREQRDKLERAMERGVQKLNIVPGNTEYYHGFVVSCGGDTAIENQPSSIKVLMDAFIQTSITAYQREIDELEKEFNAL